MAHLPEIPFALQTPDKDEKKADAGKVEEEIDPFKQQGEGAGFRAVVVGAAAAAGEQTAAEVVPFRLFRFFDYNVESSRSYIYRVKLVLGNPNRGVVKRHLKDPKLAEGDTRDCPWSDPSPVAVIPHDYRMLAGDVKAPVGAKEAQAKILIIKWEAPKGVEVAHEFGGPSPSLAEKGLDLVRGTLLDFAEVDAAIPNPATPETTTGKVSFTTSTLLLDMTGGELIQMDKLGGTTSARIRSPSEMVFMGASGEIFTRSAVTDYPEYAARKPAGAAKKEKVAEESETPGAPPTGGKTIFNLNK
jgi:hypothetical protein